MEDTTEQRAAVAPTLPPGSGLVLYDGYCVLCNGSIRWLLRRDSKSVFFFAPQASPMAQQIMARHGIAVASASGNQRGNAFGNQPGSVAGDLLGKPSGGASGDANTVCLVLGLGTPQERVLSRSAAALACLRMLGGRWAVAAALLAMVPRPIRDALYRLVAWSRYRIFGRLAVCPVPPAKARSRFLNGSG
ncbi:MAG: thiol-disulfide oxidoreductase DCC family protein [Acidobacteriaceae bacterium]